MNIFKKLFGRAEPEPEVTTIFERCALAIHRVTSNYDLVDNPIALRSDCGEEIAFPRRFPVERLILGQRIPSFAAKSETDMVCFSCSHAGPLRDKGIWESYWQQATPSQL